MATSVPRPESRGEVRIRLALLDETGATKLSMAFDKGVVTVGRQGGDLGTAEDRYLSPSHAQFLLRDGTLVLRDLGSRNGSWVFLDGPRGLADGDVLLIGLQLLRFRRIGYPAPQSPEPDGTKRIGSLTPKPDVAVLAQLRADGSVRDMFHLSAGRNVTIGRDEGDWVFPYDQTMSGRHAEIRAEDGEFVVYDLSSRNGVAIVVRGECELKQGQRVLVGDYLLAVESE
jgi:pSer/pThr/pTyr-binding forkhead associated (FHA) protein